MTERLPLFPVGTVLFPGLVLPLHIFEERYRLLVRDLLDRPEPRRFGIVCIELGHEVGITDGPRWPSGPGEAVGGAGRPERAGRERLELADVGCVAEVHAVDPHEDGRYDIVTVGGGRFRIKGVDASMPYLRAEAEMLPEEAGPEPDDPALRVSRQFQLYRHRLAAAGAEVAEPIELPGDPVRLSYLIAAALVLDRDEKQRLLEAEDATVRLRAERELLIRENRLLDVLPAVPAGPFLDNGAHPN